MSFERSTTQHYLFAHGRLRNVAAVLSLPSKDSPGAVVAEWALTNPAGGLSHVNFGDRPVLPEDEFLA